MTPETVHLLARVIEHSRGLATAADRWVESDSFSRDEARVVIRTMRGVLDSYERQLRDAVVVYVPAAGKER